MRDLIDDIAEWDQTSGRESISPPPENRTQSQNTYRPIHYSFNPFAFLDHVRHDQMDDWPFWYEPNDHYGPVYKVYPKIPMFCVTYRHLMYLNY